MSHSVSATTSSIRPSRNRTPPADDPFESVGRANPTIQITGARNSNPANSQVVVRSVFELCLVNGRWPFAVRETNRMTMKIRRKPMPTHASKRNAYAHPGAVTKRNLRHVSAGRPVIAQTGGKSFAASCEAQTWTLSVGALTKTEQLVQAAIEARLTRDHPPDREHHAGDIRFA